MENKSYFDAFGATINPAEVASKAGLSYIAAATAMRLSGRPEVTFVDFDGKPYLEMLGGAVVAVDMKVPGTEKVQRMYLPVMDRDNLHLSLPETSLTDINNSRQRCLVKAIAAVYGDGMSLYMGCGGDGAKAVKLLGVTPETDLESVQPVIATLKEGGAPYIEWNVGLAACRITDATFHWEVVMWNGLPFREVLGGLMVDVDTVYDGMRQRLSLPVMDAAHNPVPVDKASVMDWNKAVMRALTKCIAFNTGYGLGVYADEFGNKDKDDADAKAKGRKTTPAKADAKSEAKADAKAETKVEAKAETKVETNAETKVAAAPAAAEAAPAADVVTQAATAPAEAAAEPAAQAQADGEQVNAAEGIAATSESDAAAGVAVAVAAAAAAPAAAEASAPAAAEVATPAGEAAAPADSEAVSRFRDVMRKRKEAGGVAGVLTLFEALKTSTKFADGDKPACFAALVNASASLVDAEHIQELLGNLVVYKAWQYVPKDSRDVIGAKLTAVALNTAVGQGDAALDNAHIDLMSAGVALDAKDVLRLAALGNVPQETIDLLRDIVELTAA